MDQHGEHSAQLYLPVSQRLAAVAATVLAGLLACGALLAALGGLVRPAYASTLTFPGCASWCHPRFTATSPTGWERPEWANIESGLANCHRGRTGHHQQIGKQRKIIQNP